MEACSTHAEATTSDLDSLLEALSEPVGVYDPARGRLHETRALTVLLDREPESDRVRAAMCRAAEAVPVGPHSFAVGPPETVATRRTTYDIYPSRLPRGLLASRPILIVLVNRRVAVPGIHSIMERFELTRRQAEVAILLAQRSTNAEVAQTLSISPHTARRHTEMVLAKLNLDSRLDVRERIG